MASRTTTREPTGWVIFGAVMMFLIGSLDFFYGLAAVAKDQVVVVGGHGAIIADLTTWGWVTMILGVVLVLVAFGLFVGSQAGSVGGDLPPHRERRRAGLDFPRRAAVGVHRDPAQRDRDYNLCARWTEPV